VSENSKQDDQAAQIEWLELQLQDTYLVIGRQQIALLRAEQVNQTLQRQLEEMQTSD